MNNLIIGSHVSFGKDKQLLGSLEEALSYGANAFMIYTGAPQNTRRSEIDDELTKKALNKMKEEGMDPTNIVVHAPYIINLANNIKKDSYKFAIDFLKQEIARSEKLGIDKIVLHPGSHVALTKEEGIKNIIAALNEVLKEDGKAKILLETMSGKGTEVGSKFEEIKTIIDGVEKDHLLGVCLDTCHINDAGYEVKNFDIVLDEFDKIIGLDRLMCIHVNDSKNELGAAKDRHENFGFGNLGFDTLINVLYNERIMDIPKILETPYVTESDESKVRAYPPYKFEIEMIRNKKFDEELINKIRNYYKGGI